MSEVAVLRPLTGPPGSRLGCLLGAGLEPFAPLRGVTGCLERIVAGVSSSESVIIVARAGLPDGTALAEAMAVRLRRSGVEIRWGAPVVVRDVRSLLELCRSRGRSSVDLVRADPSLLTELQLGGWFDASWRMRALRRAAQVLRCRGTTALAPRARWWLAAAADLWFWEGVRDRAAPQEWRRLTKSSYVALVYHRFAGEHKLGQERIDIAPARFARQLRALRLARFRPLHAKQILSFHSGTADLLPPRSFVITVDDALADAVAPLLRHSDCAPQLFVPTRELAGTAHWIAGEPVATWENVRALAAAGVAIGSHARRHRRLTPLDDAARIDELAGSLADLRERLTAPLEFVAFPNGDHDLAVCRAAHAAGYRAAYTTQKGRNGAGTDPYCLRRVSIHGHDGGLAVLWKVVVGEGLPSVWLRLRALRLGLPRLSAGITCLSPAPPARPCSRQPGDWRSLTWSSSS